jgi:hypothetical protein
MTVLKPRTRMISVRLSQEEYSALRDVCSLTGARSVSDLTRDAVRTVLRGVNREDSSGANLEEFRSGIKNLERRVERLEAKLTTFESESTQ